jgi:hypothetical protein
MVETIAHTPSCFKVVTYALLATHAAS